MPGPKASETFCDRTPLPLNPAMHPGSQDHTTAVSKEVFCLRLLVFDLHGCFFPETPRQRQGRSDSTTVKEKKPRRLALSSLCTALQELSHHPYEGDHGVAMLGAVFP